MGRMGWRPDKPDHRDHKYQLRNAAGTLPAGADLRSGMPPIYDQGDLGSCVANALAGAYQFDRIKQRGDGYPYSTRPSRLFIYYNGRVIEGTVFEDSGLEIRDGIKTLSADGAPPERSWPYRVERFETQPPVLCYTRAKLHKAVEYERVDQSTAAMKDALVNGFPIVVGFSVYESFESDEVAATGHVPYPDPNESLLGGHAVLVCGYLDASQEWICRNSWGREWGEKGYFYMPYSYLTNPDLASDFWKIEVVT